MKLLEDKNRNPLPHRGKFAELLNEEGTELKKDIFLELDYARDGMF